MRQAFPARAAAAFVLALFSVRAAAAAIAPAFSASPERKPEHVLLVILDGLSFKAWDKADIPALRRLRERGSVVEQVFLPPAAHPRVGPYARIHTCSIPNPIMMAGTIFIDEKTEYVSSRLYPGRITAFVADALGYESLTRDYHLLYQKTGTDSEAVDAALVFLERYRPAFLRLHLQQTGDAGSRVMNAAADAPWKSDIWHPESPYRASLEQAAAEIGRLANRIEALGWMDRTAIMVLGDHGQADTGWHPLELPESSITTLVVAGAGVKSAIRLPYGELVDVVPTICRLLGVEPPVTSRGRVLAEALTDWSGPRPPRPETQKRLNILFSEARGLMSALAARLETVVSPRRGEWFSRFNRLRTSFYGIDRFVEWPAFASAEELLAADEKALSDLRALAGEVARRDQGPFRE